MHPAVFEDEIAEREVSGARTVVARDGVAIPVEDVALDNNVRSVARNNAVARRVVVAVNEGKGINGGFSAVVGAGMLVVGVCSCRVPKPYARCRCRG